MSIEIKNHNLWVNDFLCFPPDLNVNDDGNIVIIKRACFGPLEVYEWGINQNGKPYEIYQWCENDFYEDQNYTKEISNEAFIKQIEYMKEIISNTEFSSWNAIYDKAVEIIMNINN